MKELLQLNLTEIIRSRAGKKGRWIPDFLLRGLERVIRQKELNELLRVGYPAEGSEFSRRILNHLDIMVEVSGLDRLQESEEASASGTEATPYVFASNHPLGGLDGIALVAVLGERFGDGNIRVMVNDLLMNVSPLAGVFLPINKYGSKGARQSSLLLQEAMESGKQIVMFPAGLVSRLQKGGIIKDLQWKKSFVSKAMEYQRSIVPVHFEALNSMKFYRTARWRKKLGIKVNIEQALLPSELCKSQGKNFVIKFGEPIDPAALKKEGKTLNEIVDYIYTKVYEL